MPKPPQHLYLVYGKAEGLQKLTGKPSILDLGSLGLDLIWSSVIY